MSAGRTTPTSIAQALRLIGLLGVVVMTTLATAHQAQPRRSSGRSTTVTIVQGTWHLNGEATYRGAPAEGLLMNVRMVNAVFLGLY